MSSSLLFLTGNAGKLREVQALLPEAESWDVDLPEIQSADARPIIEAKLLAAAQMLPGRRLIVEDTSLYLDALGGLPGPLIKWFVAPKSLGVAGLAEIAAARGMSGAQATTWIGLFDPEDGMQFFDGTVAGKIVSPRGDKGFGWDPIFQPQGSERTFAEMAPEEKKRFSMRAQALESLQQFLARRG